MVSSAVTDAKQRGVQKGHGEGLWVSTKVFPENHSASQAGKMGDHLCYVQQGWNSVDLYWGSNQEVKEAL